MISYNYLIICSYSILLAVIVGFLRFRNINYAYQPFMLFALLLLFNESVNPVMIRAINSNAINTNLFNLLSGGLWLWQFLRWKTLKKQGFRWMLLTLAGVWAIDNLLLGEIYQINSVSSLLLSVALVVLATDTVNRLVIEEKKKLYKNATFLICIGIMVSHVYKTIVEAIYLAGIDRSTQFLSYIYLILITLNLITNIIYAVATLWIPTRERFTMEY